MNWPFSSLWIFLKQYFNRPVQFSQSWLEWRSIFLKRAATPLFLCTYERLAITWFLEHVETKEIAVKLLKIISNAFRNTNYDKGRDFASPCNVNHFDGFENSRGWLGSEIIKIIVAIVLLITSGFTVPFHKQFIYQFCCCCFPYIVYTTKCERVRLEALASGPLLGQFVPHCGDDGSYEPAQCWASTGYCWCVDQNGERKAGSMVRFKHPVCL